MSLFDGIELADSITVDAHKSLFSPIGFGMVLYRSPHASAPIAKTVYPQLCRTISLLVFSLPATNLAH